MNDLLRPVRLVPLAFLLAVTVGTLLLLLPVSRTDDSVSALLPAAFTAVAAVCVTGLTVVDTATFWTPFGQGVILALVQVGGFGIMTLATLLASIVSGKLGLRSMLVTQTETHTTNLGDIRGLLRRVALTMLAFEAVLTIVLTARFRIAYDNDLGTALWHGGFHAVSGFNSAGYSLFSDNLVGFVTDAWICVTLSVAVIAGGIGFPVLNELTRRTSPLRWTVHTRVTVYGSLILLVAGIGGTLVLEWSNPGTFGPLSVPDKLTAATVTGSMPRTGGFNSIDYRNAHPETLAITNVLMFIGGGSGGTAGGIKVTTFFLLAFVILAEIAGDRDVTVAHRRVPGETQRQALTVALLGVAVVAVGTLALLMLSPHRFDLLLFEATSAFSTAGLTSGITPTMSLPAHGVLMLLMFVGRVGTVTVASALALRSRQRLYQLPDERPIVG